MRRSFRWQFYKFNQPFPDFQEMETTTLVTFMLHHVGARTVELLGSWDNFSESYRMERDDRKGYGHWTGCHTFKDIICDGDLEGPPSPKRDGGLKQGGTYWYYYRIDGIEEYHNPAQPSTTSCPFLPGQTLNVLDVPLQIQQSGSKSRSNSIILSAAVHTLDPEDRYINPRPPPTPPLSKPKLPKLITPAVMDINNQSSVLMDRPWTAGVKLSKDDLDMMFPKIRRNIKSASTSPSSMLRTAFSHLKDPSSALTPSQGGRGRSRTLHSERTRSGRTNDPSIRELRMTWPQSAISPSSLSPEASPMDIPSPRPESPMELSPNGYQLLPKKRRSLQRLLDVEEEPEVIEMFPSTSEMRMPRRSVSTADGRLHRRGRSSDDFRSRRSSSLGRTRAPSPLRQVLSQEDNFPTVRIPENIQEVDWEDLRSPRRPIESSVVSLSPLDVNKELPALPSYLIPDPLFSHTPRDEGSEDVTAATLAAFSSPRSHFSIWSTASEDDPGSPVTDGNTNSPTLSSTKGASTGVNTPGLSPEQQSVEEFLSKEDLKSLSLELPDQDPYEALMDGKTPTAASFQLHSLQKGLQVGNQHPRTEVQIPHQQTQMEDLLDQFEYLGAAVV